MDRFKGRALMGRHSVLVLCSILETYVSNRPGELPPALKVIRMLIVARGA